MLLRKLGVFISLALAASLLVSCGTVYELVSAVSKASAIHQSQIEFLETYGYLANGTRPGYAIALATVIAHPNVPTMAEAKSFGMENITVNLVSTPNTALQPNASTGTSDIQTYTSGYTWWHGPSFARGLGWVQDMTITCNTKTNKILSRSTSGYWYVSTWASWVWHYTGEYSSDGYPKWIYGGGGNKPRWVKYLLIETFGWGYGPISGQLAMRMYIIGYTNGKITGGNF